MPVYAACWNAFADFLGDGSSDYACHVYGAVMYGAVMYGANSSKACARHGTPPMVYKISYVMGVKLSLKGSLLLLFDYDTVL